MRCIAVNTADRVLDPTRTEHNMMPTIATATFAELTSAETAPAETSSAVNRTGATGAKPVFMAPTQWQPQLWHRPVFAGLARLFQLDKLTDFPDLAQQSQWLARGIEQNKHPHHEPAYIEPTYLEHYRRSAVSLDNLVADGRYYEAFIASTGQIPTRQRNWHDLFGNLIWALLPRSKAAMNAAHCMDIARDGLTQRSRRRHRLTQLDECGVLVLYPAHIPGAQHLIEQLQQHQWLAAMWQQRHSWKDFWQSYAALDTVFDTAVDGATQAANTSETNHNSDETRGRPWCSAFILGHANLEMLTAPFRGLTGKMWPLAVPDDFLQWPVAQRLDFIDTVFSQQIANVDVFMAQCVSPLPLLGVPGWADGQTESLYLDTGYFRPKPSPR